MQQRTMIIVTVVLAVVVALLTVAILAGLYLTGGETTQVPVASQTIPPNTRIEQSHLTTKEIEGTPASNTLTETGNIVGKISQSTIESGAQFASNDLGDQFTLVKSTQEITAGTRISNNMVTEVTSSDFPSGAIANASEIQGKMARQSISANTIVQSEDVYQSLKKAVVATEPIPANSMIREGQVKVVEKGTLPPDPMTDLESVVGRSAKRKLHPAQPIRQSDLFPETNQLSYFIPLYRRAVTIPVSNYNNLSYMLRPGDQVDLYVYLPQGFVRSTAGNQQNADVLGSDVLQKVADGAQILSLNDVFTKKEIQQIESGGENQKAQQFSYQEMTLGVTLWEAEKINLVRGQQQAGNQNIRFFVILRPHQLQSSYGYRSVNNYDLFGRELGNATSRDVSGPQVQVIQGQQRETYRVQDYR